MQQKLNRTLGLYSAITISVGTMIGSAIFVLAGTSYETAGPSASLAVFLAGLAAAFTACSFAELVTFIPRSGGGYAYVRDASDNGLLGFICGWGFWLGYAMSCGLFALGFGTFLNYFFPFIPQMAGAYALILYVTLMNVQGIKKAGSFQNLITSGLAALLLFYVIYGIFHVDLSYQVPYFSKGFSGTFTAMGFLYITYIGYGLVTTASEEVIQPEKTIPKAIFISLAAVIFIKTAVFFLGSAMIPWRDLVPSATATPLTDTAIRMGGSWGGYLFAFAGILATVSSMNTAMLAASRTSFAMARDQRLPAIFKHIHPKTKTPVFSILFAAVIVFISTSIRDLNHIATLTSIFALAGYSLVNVAVMIFRRRLPDAKRAFRVPLYPLTPILGVLVNVFLAAQLMMNDVTAMTAAAGVMMLGIGYFYLMLPKLENAPQGMTTQPVPSIDAVSHAVPERNYSIVTLISNLKTASPIIELGLAMAKSYGGSVIPVHVVKVPPVIPFDSRYPLFKDEIRPYEELIGEISHLNDYHRYGAEPVSVISRNVVRAVCDMAKEADADLIIMGWHRSGFASRMRGSIILEILEEMPVPVAIFKPGKNQTIKKIVYAYGGGYHCQAAITQLKRIAQGCQARVTFLRIAEHGTSEEDIQKIRKIMEDGLADIDLEGEVKIRMSDSMRAGVIEEAKEHDLLVIGASHEWGLKSYVTGSHVDIIMENIQCAGLVIRGKKTLAEERLFRGIISRLKKNLLP